MNPTIGSPLFAVRSRVFPYQGLGEGEGGVGSLWWGVGGNQKVLLSTLFHLSFNVIMMMKTF